MEWYKVAFGELYPLVYPHRDVAEAARVASRLAPLLRRSRPTLDVACGNGRYMSALVAAGVDVYGVDLSEYLLGEAVKQGALKDRVVCGDMRALPFVAGAFGAVINMFTSFGYFDTDEENRGVLREIERVLVVQGTFVMDFINAERVRRGVEPCSLKKTGDAEVEAWRELSADGRVLTKRVQVRWPSREPVEYQERVRLYTRDELASMLDAAGFDIVSVHGDYELGNYDAVESPRVILVSEKRMVLA
jgi:SAM-dependent methyltransferase